MESHDETIFYIMISCDIYVINTQFVVRTIIYHLIVKTETLRMNERANDLFSENVTQFPNLILEKIARWRRSCTMNSATHWYCDVFGVKNCQNDV